jgi:hypothetical protein
MNESAPKQGEKDAEGYRFCRKCNGWYLPDMYDTYHSEH